MADGSLFYLLAMLVVPGLIGLMLLMQWLETHIAHRMIADQIAALLHVDGSIDDLEAQIARTSEPVVVALRGMRGATALDQRTTTTSGIA